MDLQQSQSKAQLLYQQGRYDMAANELQLLLSHYPDHGVAHSLLSLCLLQQEKYSDAENSAREGIRSDPDSSFAHYALAMIQYQRNRNDDARQAINTAIELDPEDPDFYSLRGFLAYKEQSWQSALQSAEIGLEHDPEHEGCNNLRAMSMVKLGQSDEAGFTIEQTLAKNPDNSMTHANMGWTLLERGEHQQAVQSFKESLRLDPENEWAKSGLVNAIKASNFLVGFMLKYFLWMSKLTKEGAWGVIIGGFIGYRILRVIANSSPSLAPFIQPILYLYIAFCLTTWIVQPLSNLTLFLHPLGKHALDRDEKLQAKWTGGLILVALMFLGLSLLSGETNTFGYGALVFGLLVIPVSSIFSTSEGWPRKMMVLYSAGLAVCGLISYFLMTSADHIAGSENSESGGILISLFLLGGFIAPWVSNYLMTRETQL